MFLSFSTKLKCQILLQGISNTNKVYHVEAIEKSLDSLKLLKKASVYEKKKKKIRTVQTFGKKECSY